MKENGPDTYYFDKALEPIGESMKVFKAGLKPVLENYDKHRPIITYEIKSSLHRTFPNHPFLVELFMNMFIYR